MIVSFVFMIVLNLSGLMVVGIRCGCICNVRRVVEGD